MIPIWNEPTSIQKAFPHTVEKCIFCNTPTRTWHENTNNPICIHCAKIYKVSDIEKDYGVNIRKRKRNGTFNREDSTRAN